MNIRELSFLTDRERSILQKNKIESFEQLLYYFPYKYLDAPREKLIGDVQANEYVTISGVIVDIEAKTGYHSGAKFTKAIVQDDTDTIEAIWWNMPFLAKSFSIDQKVILTGTVSEKNEKLLTSRRYGILPCWTS